MNEYLNSSEDPSKLYEKLIKNSQERKLSKGTYCEMHHIVPRCKGGDNSENNLVTLTALEHIIAHILLSKIYPEDKKIIRAADCMLSLVSPSTKERQEALSNIPLEFLSELREKASAAKRIPVVCFKYSNDNSIDIYRIFDSVDSAKDEGFIVTRTTVNSRGNSGGYNWMNLQDAEIEYPESISKFNELLELPDLEINNKSWNRLGEGSIVCLDNSGQLIREYSSLVEASKDDFFISGISQAIKLKKPYKSHYWRYSDEYSKEFPEEYERFKKLTELPDIIIESPKLICHDSDYNILKIYDNLNQVQDDGFCKTRVCKDMKKGKSSGGYYWTYLKNWTRLDKLDEYKEPKVITKIKSPVSKIRVIKTNLENDFLQIYESLHHIESVSFKSLSKILQQPTDKREFKGFNWYRTSEYLELFPEKAKYIDNIVEREYNKTELKILLTIPEKLVSVNELYKARISYSFGKPYPVLYKNPRAVKVGNIIRDQMLALDLKGYIPWLNKTKKYEILMNFVLKTGIYRRDVQNLDKEIIDDLTRFIKNDLGISHFDDSEIFKCTFAKSICPSAEKEFVYVILKESSIEERIDLVDKPTRLYLSGSYFPNVPWRFQIASKFKDSGLECFNPEEYLWDLEHRNIEKFSRCNSELFVITPGDLSEELSQTIIETASSKGTGKFLYVSVYGDLDDYSEEELGRIIFIENLLKGGNRIYFKYITDFNELVNWIVPSKKP